MKQYTVLSALRMKWILLFKQVLIEPQVQPNSSFVLETDLFFKNMLIKP
jgi:hypothetical protein